MPSGRGMTAPGAPLAALRHRDFRVLLGSNMALQVGSWVQTIGQGWLVLHDLDGSAFQLGLVALLRGASLVVVSPFGGYLAGRLELRKQLLAYSSVTTTIAILLAGLITTGHIEIWMVYATALAAGAVEGLAGPIRVMMVYNAVGPDDLTNAVALNGLGGNAMRVIGPAIGGVLIGLVGTEGTFQVQAVCLVFAMVLTVMLPKWPPDVPESDEGPLRSIGGGLAYVVRDRRMAVIVLMALVPSLLIYPYVTFLPVFARDVLGSNEKAYGYLAAAVGLGSLLGGGIVAVRADKGRMGPGMMWGCFLYCLMVVAFTFTRNVQLGVVALVGAGVFHSIYAAYNASLMQLKAEKQYRSRVLALQTMTWGVTPFAAVLMGEMIDRWGAPHVVAVWVGVAAVATLAISIASKEVRRL